MFLFTHGDAQYNVYYYNSDQPYTVQIARTVGTCVAHPAQNVTMVHELTYPEQVEDVTVDGSENLLKIRLINDVEDTYTFGEIESFFTGEGEEDDKSVDQIKDSDEYRMPNYKWDSKYVEKFLKHNQQDNVNHPAHYQSKSGLETIDVIEAFTEDLNGIEAVCTGNALKYLCRWKHKNGVEDLKKATWYIRRLIDIKEAQK